MTLEEQLAEQAKKGLLGLGLEEETAEQYAPWASLLAQFIPGVGEGVGVDNTVDAIQDERYGDAAIEGGLTLLGAVPVVGDFAAAAIKGIRKAPVKAFDEAAWLKENPKPHADVRVMDMTAEQRKKHKAWIDAKRYASDPSVLERDKARKVKSYESDPAFRERRKAAERDRWKNDPDTRLRHKKRTTSEDYKEQQRLRKTEKLKDPEHRELVNRRQREWYRKNYDSNKSNPSFMSGMAEKRAKRRASEIQRTPAWADPDRIDEIYRTAADVSAETGIPHHVDHVMPLQGKNVSGLHHQDNLLVVPGAENLSKSNKFEPGKPPPRAGVRKARKLLKDIRDGKKK